MCTTTELNNYLNGIDEAEIRAERNRMELPFQFSDFIIIEEIKEDFKHPSKFKHEFMILKNEDIFNLEVVIKGRKDRLLLEITCMYDAYGFTDANDKCSHLETVISDIIYKITE